MKKAITISAILIIAFSAVTIQSCKKSSSSTPAPTTTPPPATSVICNGNGTTSNYPLAANNTWHYKDASGNTFDNTVGSTVTYGAYTYFIVSSTQGGTLYLRQAANGDIMAYDGSNADVLYIPAAPTVNQTWQCQTGFGYYRKVVSTNASLTTSSCSYTGLLEIQDLNSIGGSVFGQFYYKKGVGDVSDWQSSPGTTFLLSTLTLH